MKKTLFSLTAIVIMALAGTVSAATFAGGKSYSLGSKQVINDDLYAAGNQVVISGAVNEDIVVAGANILINERVGQDLLAAGGTITALSEIGDSARLVGGQIMIGSNVTKDVVALGGTIQILSGVEIGRDATLIGGAILMGGKVAGKLNIKGDEVEINGLIPGNVKITAARSLKIGKDAVIGGNLEYFSPQKAQIEEGATIKGETRFTAITANDKKLYSAKKTLWEIFGAIAFIKLLTLLVTGLLLIVLFGKWVTQTVNSVHKTFGWEILRGLVFLIVVPVVSLLLLATIIGIFPAIISLLAYGLAIIISGSMTGVFFGALLWKWIYKTKDLVVDWKSTMAGIVFLWIIALIPFIGWIISLVLFLAVLGGIVFVAYKKVRAR